MKSCDKKVHPKEISNDGVVKIIINIKFKLKLKLLLSKPVVKYVFSLYIKLP